MTKHYLSWQKRHELYILRHHRHHTFRVAAKEKVTCQHRRRQMTWVFIPLHRLPNMTKVPLENIPHNDILTMFITRAIKMTKWKFHFYKVYNSGSFRKAISILESVLQQICSRCHENYCVITTRVQVLSKCNCQITVRLNCQRKYLTFKNGFFGKKIKDKWIAKSFSELILITNARLQLNQFVSSQSIQSIRCWIAGPFKLSLWCRCPCLCACRLPIAFLW